MSILITFIKLLAVFDLLVIAAYFWPRHSLNCVEQISEKAQTGGTF